MSAIASRLRSHRLELVLAFFVAANVAAMIVLGEGVVGSIPFHLIWLSLTVVYGFRVWRPGPTAAVIALAVTSTSAVIGLDLVAGRSQPEEFFEVPLMATTFLAMAWHSRRLASAEREATRLRERERDFVRDASHTLKAPLARARGYSELLLGARPGGFGPSDDTVRLVGELDCLSTIVDSLLLLLTSGEGRAAARRAFDLRDLVLEVADRWGVHGDRVVVASVTEAVEVVGDRDRIARALDALVENAVQATTAGQRIRLVASRVGDTARVLVVDEGHGIAPEDADHVFERFWSRPQGGVPRGTGLGLAIVRAIVEGHGGTAAVNSSGRGTTATICLPAAGAPTTRAPERLLPGTLGGPLTTRARPWRPASR